MRLPAALVLLAACGGARPTPAVSTGDPLPVRATGPAACDAGWQWLDSDPHVPLAVTGPDGIADASGCCAAWARAGDAWTEVDAWGAPSGTRTISGGEGYDVTQCYELTTEPAAAGLLVRGAAPWQAPPSAAWTPSDAERASALALAAAIDVVFAPSAVTADAEADAEPESPAATRLTFFQLAPDEASGSPVHFVAIGGRALAIAAIDARGAWTVRYLDGAWGLGAPWIGDVYRVIGVFDVDGDGFPEVIVHRNEGTGWDDAIFTCEHDSTLRVWQEAAASVGGSTA